ncbi:hypothetical protein QUF70_07975 [Desulfobacterales bacterium HSG17]|nr:hypothetical protein [Desulfobacterales bacterium HSG17]
MKLQEAYSELIDLALKLKIEIAEKSFRNIGIPVRSGFCIVKNENRILIDKHLTLREKVRMLSGYLNQQAINDVFIKPAVRDYLEKMKDRIEA